MRRLGGGAAACRSRRRFRWRLPRGAIRRRAAAEERFVQRRPGLEPSDVLPTPQLLEETTGRDEQVAHLAAWLARAVKHASKGECRKVEHREQVGEPATAMVEPEPRAVAGECIEFLVLDSPASAYDGSLVEIATAIREAG